MAAPVPDFPVYATSYSKNARALRDALPEDLRAALIEVEDELSENPEKHPLRLVPLGENLFIYKHPNPSIEITYRIDPDRKILFFMHLVAPKLEVSKQLFISYSHKDELWLVELKKWLKPLEQRDLISVWDDQQLQAGDLWREEIQKALASAKAAVLLISQDFLVSDFISNHELPRLLDAAQDTGLSIFWIAVSESTVEDTEIARYQAVHKEPPLDCLDPAQQKRQFKEIYKRIKEVVEA